MVKFKDSKDIKIFIDLCSIQDVFPTLFQEYLILLPWLVGYSLIEVYQMYILFSNLYQQYLILVPWLVGY